MKFRQIQFISGNSIRNATKDQVSIKKRPELRARVEMIKIELSKVNRMMSGRALYWVILYELRQSHNTIGLMNITDSGLVECSGPKVHHLRMFQTFWDKCLMNFSELPPDSMLQPLYEKQVKRNDASGRVHQNF